LQVFVAGLEGGRAVDDPVHPLFEVANQALQVVDVLLDILMPSLELSKRCRAPVGRR
jgi:hypothetical protein